MRILVVEDEARIADLLVRGLLEEGHEPTVAPTLAAARIAVAAGFDLLIVDRMLPDGDGLSLVRERREANDLTPMLVLTARDRVQERIEGLHGGADDYLTKPFSFEELLARIAAVCRRTQTATVLRCANLTVDLSAMRVHRGESELRLTAQELRLLRFLLENQGRVLSRARILEAVWDTEHDPGTNVVEVYMSYLRTKVDKGFSPKLIHTVRGLGYLLEAAAP